MTQQVDYEVDSDGGNEELPENLYEYHGIATGVDGFDAITSEHIEFFHEYGYLVINNALDETEVTSAIQGLMNLIEGKYPGFKGIQFEKEARDILHTLSPGKKQDYVRKCMSFVKHEPLLMEIAEHPQLIEVVSRIMGEAPELSQDMALLKPPLIGREKPWHQDNAYFNFPPEATIVGAWIALDEATPENGCMHIIPGTHRDGPVVHFKRRDWQICDTNVQVGRTVAVPLKPGGCLLFHGLLHHGTPPSRSEKRRKALQYHYKPASLQTINPKDRLAIFGSEGKDVSC